MRSWKDLAVMLAAVILVAGAVPAVSAQSGDPAVVPALVAQLAADGWSPQETQALSDAASGLDWSGTRGVNPQVVAIGLELAKSQDGSLTAGTQAELALQLALSTARLSAAGLDDHATAAAALAGVQAAISDIHTWIANGRQGNLGEIIRKNVAKAVHGQLHDAAMTQSAADGQGFDRGEGNAPITPPGQGGSFPPQNPRK